MRNLSFCKGKWDKKYFFAFLIALGCAFICGIVLCKAVNSSVYMRERACEYVDNVFNFKNSPLILSHLLGDLLYFYIFFLIAYFTKLKYITLIFTFLRGLFFGIYLALLISVNAFGGVLVVILVFIPATLLSLAVCYFICEFCKEFPRKIAFFVPLLLALADALIMLILVNVLFRVVIIIV